jgi:hypothetical protein
LLDRDIPAMVADEEFDITVDDVVRASEDIAITFVNKHKEIEPNLKRFITKGKRRGGKFRYFADRESAEKWLLKQYRLN